MNSMVEIECVGGPYDGERKADRGFMWTVVATVHAPTPEPWEGEPAVEVRPGASGVYVKGKDGRYHWEPD